MNITIPTNTVSSSFLCFAFSSAFIKGSVLENCLNCYLPLNFLTALYPKNSNVMHTIWIRGTPLLCGFVKTYFHATHLWNGVSATAIPGRYNMDTLKSTSISTLKTDNLPVALLTL